MDLNKDVFDLIDLIEIDLARDQYHRKTWNMLKKITIIL